MLLKKDKLNAIVITFKRPGFNNRFDIIPISNIKEVIYETVTSITMLGAVYLVGYNIELYGLEIPPVQSLKFKYLGQGRHYAQELIGVSFIIKHKHHKEIKSINSLNACFEIGFDKLNTQRIKIQGGICDGVACNVVVEQLTKLGLNVSKKESNLHGNWI